MRKPAIIAAVILLLPLVGAAIAGVSVSGPGAEGPQRAGFPAARPGIQTAQSSADQCKQDCRSKFKCNEIIATPGLRNPDLIACRQNLQACIGGCQ